MYKDNVIDFKAALEKRKNKQSGTSQSTGNDIIDLASKRAEIIRDERRQVKRTILTEFISAHIVVPGRGLCKVSLYDISEQGLAFELEKQKGGFVDGEELAVRIYLNQKTYFPFVIKVKNMRLIDDEDIYRVGGEYTEDSLNKEALRHFVKFIETVSASLKNDNGDVIVSSINS